MQNDEPLWEVFIRSKQGLDHKHVGSLHAADAKMAIENARDVYTRRMEGVSICVVESKIFMPLILTKQQVCMIPQMTKSIGILPFMNCRMN